MKAEGLAVLRFFEIKFLAGNGFGGGLRGEGQGSRSFTIFDFQGFDEKWSMGAHFTNCSI